MFFPTKCILCKKELNYTLSNDDVMLDCSFHYSLFILKDCIIEYLIISNKNVIIFSINNDKFIASFRYGKETKAIVDYNIANRLKNRILLLQ